MMEDNNRSEVTPLEFLEAVYVNPNLPLNARMRAAIEAAPYRHPKLTAVAHRHFEGNDFATQLERAIARSRGETPALLNQPKVVEHDPAELKTPNARYRRY
jgi:hypothetical protein